MEFSNLIGLILFFALLVTPVVLWKRKLKVAAIVFVAGFGLLWIGIALPGLKPVRAEARRAACINNLRVIQNAKLEWAKTNQKSLEAVPSDGDLFGTNHFKPV